ncbi:hypothetical protein AMTRI_Chr09g33890 [Amborella trichopoda]
MKCIERLPRSVCSSLRSSAILFDLPKVVEELIYNSVDARATKVHVSVSIGTGYIKVEDDGCGITREDLVLLGERYATSKLHSLAELDASIESLGFRGEALSSLSDVSLLEVITKARGRANAYHKVIKGCKCLSLGIDGHRQDVGTTVIVRDLFYKQPVRRKYLQSSPRKVLHSVKKCVLRFALLHPEVSFKVTDLESEDELLCTFPSSSPLPLVTKSFGEEVSSHLQKVDYSRGALRISGYLSNPADAFSTKVLQYIYINSRFVSKSPIHKLLNRMAVSFQYSLVSGIGESLCQGKQSAIKEARHLPSYPAYILNLRCPLATYDLTSEPSKTIVEFKDWVLVLSFIEKAISHYWRQDPVHVLPGSSLGTEDDSWKEEKSERRSNKNPLEEAWLKHDSSTADSYEDIGKKKCKIQHFQDPETMMEENGISTHKRSFRTPLRKSHKVSPCKGDSFERNSHVWESDFKLFGGAMDAKFSEESVVTKAGECIEKDSTLELRLENSHDNTRLNKRSRTSTERCYYFEDSDEKKPFLSRCPRKLETLASKPLHFPGNMLDSSGLLYNEGRFEGQFDHYAYESKVPTFYDSLDVADVELGKESSDFFSVIPLLPKIASSQQSPLALYKYQDTGKVDLPSRGFINPHYWKDMRSIEEQIACGGLFSQDLEKGPDSESVNSRWCIRSPDSDTEGIKVGGDFENCVSSSGLSAQKVKDNFVSYSPRENSYMGGALYVSSCSLGDSYFSSCNSPERKLHRPLRNRSHLDGIFDEGSGRLRLLSSPMDSLDLGAGVANDTENFPTAFESSHFYNGLGRKKKGSSKKYKDDQCEEVSKSRTRRSSSAPPIYRGKRKFSFSSNVMAVTHGQEFPVCRSTEQIPSLPDGASEQYPELMDCSLTCVRQSPEKPSQMEISNETERNGVLERSQSIPMCRDTDVVDDSINALTKWGSADSQATVEHLNKMQMDMDKPRFKPGYDDSILDISSGLLHLASSSLIPESISKDCLDNAKVLLQLDKKFIPVTAGRYLAIIDQHAADERIRLEDLREKVLLGEGKTITYLDCEQELVLPEVRHQLLQNYAEQIQSWGWVCNFNTGGNGSFTKNLNLLQRQGQRQGQSFKATLLAVPCILGIKLSDKDLIEFIDQLVETDGSSTVPPSVLRILNFKACRGAIMFGDSLLPSECSLIVEELRATSLCFQCAHGRPTTVPLVNLEALHKQLSDLGTLNNQFEEEWHGLKRSKPSLERAKLQLSTAKIQRGTD